MDTRGFKWYFQFKYDVDLNFNNGIFNISAYKIPGNNSSLKQSIGFGLSDSLNFLNNTPSNYTLSKNGLFGVTFIVRIGCTYDYFDTTLIKNGFLTVTKLDKTNRIIAGTFNATLFKQGCDTIKITDGRFDMKF